MIAPLTPLWPAFLVRTSMEPLEVALLLPEQSDIIPPLDVSVVSPAFKQMDPPVAPIPTTTRMLPALPPTALPEVINIEPLFPFDAVPERKSRSPEDGDDAVATVNCPLDVPVSVFPVRINTVPALPVAAVPPWMETPPPLAHSVPPSSSDASDSPPLKQTCPPLPAKP
jgi:hypothetical protein